MPSDAAAEAVTQQTVTVLLALAFAAALALVVALVAGGLMRQFFVRIDDHDRAAPVRAAAVRIVRLLTFLIVLGLVAFPALDLAGVETAVGLRSHDFIRWIGRTGLRIGFIALLATAATRLVVALVGRAEREVFAGSTPADLERHKRAQTIGGILRGFVTTVIWLTGLLMILQTLDINIMPVLTGAGILGLAVGFGAQTLVKDVISGFFMLVEDQVRVGDVAVLNGTGGTVEEINLRTTVLRDAEGVVYVIPNGEIKTLANRTKDFSFAVLDVAIDYEADVDEAMAAIERAAEGVRQDPRLASSILEPLDMLGVDSVQGSTVVLKVRLKTAPSQQWAVARAFRRRIRDEFHASGIRIPFERFAVAQAIAHEASLPPASAPPPSK